MAAALHFMDHFREHWRALKAGRPGHRFQDRYERVRHEQQAIGIVRRVVLIAAAVICLAIGLVLSVMPGPAILFYFIAGGLLATESRLVARAMDWCEVRGRNGVAWAKRRWRRLSGAGRVALIAGVVSACAAAAFLAYWWLIA